MKKNTPKSDVKEESEAQQISREFSAEIDASKAKETDENLQKMAEKLSQEWKKEVTIDEKPDLSFKKLEEKLRKTD